MTKQEEIREGIAIGLAAQERSLWEGLDEKRREYFRLSADQFLAFLQEEGCVLVDKDRELPEYAPFPSRVPKPIEGAAFLLGLEQGYQDMVNAGWKATMPLVGEKDARGDTAEA